LGGRGAGRGAWTLCRAEMERLGRRFGKLGGFGSGGWSSGDVEASLYVMLWYGLGLARCGFLGSGLFGSENQYLWLNFSLLPGVVIHSRLML